MENNKYYSNTEPMTIMAFKNRPCSLKKTDPNFKQPTAKEVKMLRNLIGFSQAALAKLLGVTYNPAKGSTTVRKWETDESEKEHRPINYAAWRLLLVASNVITGTDLESEVSSLKTKAYNIDKRGFFVAKPCSQALAALCDTKYHTHNLNRVLDIKAKIRCTS